MCGIFGITQDPSQQAAQTVLEGLKKLEYRGYDSWGIAIKNGVNQIKWEKHIGKIGEADTVLPTSQLAIGHTRWATHGGVTDQNAHPHLDCTQKIAVVHNGIVENYKELRLQLKKQGHTFKSETDSEVITHLIEENKKTRSIKDAVCSTFNDLIGSNAIAVLDLESNRIIALRDGSPLAVGIAPNQLYLASDVTAFLKFTNKAQFLSDGEGVILQGNQADFFSIRSGKKLAMKPQTLDWSEEEAEKGSYPYFMLKEIHEQTATIPKTANLNQDELLKLAKKIRSYKKVMLIACGTAYHCCLMASYFLAEVGINAQAFHAHEFAAGFSQFADKNTTVIAISQSGETADTLIASRAAKKQGAHLVGVINARGSTLERLADATLPVGAGPEIAVVSTKAFTSQLATLYLLSQAIAGQLDQGQKKIKQLGFKLHKWLDKNLEKNIIDLSKTLLDQKHLYVIGKKENYPGALEFALKVKETSYLHAEAFAASELKHGVISLIQKGTPCFVLASDDELKSEVLSSAMELKTRGAKIIGIAPFNAPEFEINIKTLDLGSLTVFANIIVGQLLGYYLGLGRGADPDKPRNLAKSVTVK